MVAMSRVETKSMTAPLKSGKVKLTLLGPAERLPPVMMPCVNELVGNPCITEVGSARNHQSIGLPAAGHAPFAGSGDPFSNPTVNPDAFVPVRSVRPRNCKRVFSVPFVT